MLRFWQSLFEVLKDRPVSLATLVACEGSTPRRAGARLFVDASGTMHGTIGGGAAEGRCLELAREVLADGRGRCLSIDLRGDPSGDIRDGVCGGTMQLVMNRLEPERDQPIVESIRDGVAAGHTFWLLTRWEGDPPLELLADAPSGTAPATWLEKQAPGPLVLLTGAGHIGRELAWRLDEVGFRVLVQDDREDWLQPVHFPAMAGLHARIHAAVEKLLAWQGPRYACLVTRGLAQDIDCLHVLAPHWHRLDYLGVLGSGRRLATVRREGSARGWPPWPATTHAPVGLDIGAQSPEEIAISIAAEMIRARHAQERPEASQ